jgi:hypothetical protein
MSKLPGRATARGLALGIALTAAALAAQTAGASGGCHPGVHMVNGSEARTFCGPARATVHLPSRNVTLSGGSCERNSRNFTINIGTIVLSSAAKRPPNYFGLAVGKPAGSKAAGHDGTYTDDAAIAWVISNKHYAVLNSTVVLKHGRTRGSFSGTLLSGGPVSGTFQC